MSRETRETLARSKCHNCGGEVAVKINTGGKAYYTCDHCGFRAQHTWQRSSDAYVAKVKPAEPAAPAPAVKPQPSVRQGAGTILG